MDLSLSRASFQLSVIAVTASALLASPLWAQQVAGLQPVVAGTQIGLSPVIAQSPGQYNISQYNQTLIEQLAGTEEFQRNKADFDFFKSYMNDLNDAEKEFQNKLLADNTGLYWMSAQARGNPPKLTKAQDFLMAINHYSADARVMAAKFANLATISTAFPSRTAIGYQNSGVESVGKYGHIDFDAISANETAFLAQIDNDLKNLYQYIETGSGVPTILAGGDGNSLKLDVPIALNFDQKTIQSWQDQMDELRGMNGDTKDLINTYTLDLQDKVQHFIKAWGTTERYRLHNANDQTAEREEADRLLEAFWTRDYLRAMYGISLGAFYMRGIKKYVFNLEKVLTDTDELCTFESEPLWHDSQYIDLEQSLRNILEITQDRSTSVKSGVVFTASGGDIESTFPATIPAGYAAQKSPVLNRATSFLNYIEGKRPAALAVNAVLQLILADLVSERLVIQPGGADEVVAFYNMRYTTVPADKAKFDVLKDKYAPENMATNSGGADRNTFAYKYYKVLTFAQTIPANQIKIDQYQQNILMLSHNSKFDKAIQTRRGRLK